MAVKFTGEVGAPSQRQPEQMELEAYLEKLRSKGLGPDGHLLPDPTPMAPPVGFKRQPSMVEIVRDMVRSEALRAEVLAAGAESFEDADDFDVGDEPDQLHSPFENDFDPPIRELVKVGEEEVKKKGSKKPPAPAKPAPQDDAAGEAGDVSDAPTGDGEV